MNVQTNREHSESSKAVQNKSLKLVQLIDIYLKNVRVTPLEKDVIHQLRELKFSNKTSTSAEIKAYLVREANCSGAGAALRRFRLIQKIYNYGINKGLIFNGNPCDEISNIKSAIGYQRYIVCSTIIVALLICAMLSSFLFVATRFISKVFGKVPLDQIIVHARMMGGIGAGVPAEIINRAIKYSAETFVAGIILTALTFVVLKFEKFTWQLKRFKQKILSNNEKSGMADYRIGLGVSLLSGNKTFIEELGHDRLVSKLNKRSKFYTTLF